MISSTVALLRTPGPYQRLLHSRTLLTTAAQLNPLSHTPHGISLTLQSFLFQRDEMRTYIDYWIISDFKSYSYPGLLYST